jgi:putative salt-induced outer membrane protein YdiY/sRNA-binding regulator protein Hfq
MKKMKPKLFSVLGILCSFCLLGAGGALADEIVLVNGNTLTGTIEKVDGGKLTLKTDYSQPIEIEVAKIKKITTDKPIDLYLVSGEALKGKVTTVEDGKISVEPAPGQAPTTVELSKVAGMVTPPKVPPKWKGNIAVGASQQTGNTERKGASVGAEAIWKAEANRFTGRFLWNYAEDKGDLTARNTYGLLKYDRFFTKKFYGYLAAEGFNDKFKDWRLRYVVGPGAGYQFWDDEVKFFLLEGGVAYAYEDLYTGQNRDYISARVAADFRYKLGKYLTFGDQFVIYPNLEYGGEYTLRNEAYILSPIGAGWNLKLSNIWERNSDPPPGIIKDDLTWILALQYTF